MECVHLHNRKVTTDVRVEHKEPPGISPHDLIAEVIDTACSTKGAVLLQIPGVVGGGGDTSIM